jgi:hypothetical protein
MAQQILAAKKAEADAASPAKNILDDIPISKLQSVIKAQETRYKKTVQGAN